MVVNAIYDQVLNVCRLHYFTYLDLNFLAINKDNIKYKCLKNVS